MIKDITLSRIIELMINTPIIKHTHIHTFISLYYLYVIIYIYNEKYINKFRIHKVLTC